MNRALLAVVAVGLILCPDAADAQARFGAPVLPAFVAPAPEPERERPAPAPSRRDTPPAALADAPRDLFQAAPGAFAPRFDRVLTPGELGVWFPQSASVWPVYLPRTEYVVRERIVLVPVPVPAPPAVVAVPPAAPPPAVPLPSTAPPVRADRKTLYVIPGCYAGDKLPRPDQLRRGCSLANLRTIG